MRIGVSKSSTIAEHHTSILVAIIGIAVAVAPILVTGLSSWVSNLPIIDIDMFISYGFDKLGLVETAIMNLTNIGFGPATNVVLIVDAPSRIEYYEGRSTVNVDRIELAKLTGNTSLVMNISKIVQGSGSLVNLKMTVNASGDIPSVRYPVYVTYDQGSTKREFYWNVDNPRSALNNAIGNVVQPYASILFIPYLLFAVGLNAYMLLFWRKNWKRRRFITRVIDNLAKIRRELKENSKSQEYFNYDWDASYSQVRFIKKKEMQDFIILDDFYAELDERNQSLSSNTSENKLEALNTHLLYLANNALEKIDWTKYPR